MQASASAFAGNSLAAKCRVSSELELGDRRRTSANRMAGQGCDVGQDPRCMDTDR